MDFNRALHGGCDGLVTVRLQGLDADLLVFEEELPGLGAIRPMIVTHYPLSQAALAKTAPDDPACAARFELFVAGIGQEMVVSGSV